MLFSGYIGTYTQGDGGRAKGIYSFAFDADTGKVSDLRIAAESRNPEFLALSPSKRRLYATNELNEFEGEPSGAVSAFAVDKDGSLAFLNQVPSCGKSPCHIVLNRDATHAVVSNYLGGSICVLPINADGTLGASVQTADFTGSGPDKARQEAAHAHSFTFAVRGGGAQEAAAQKLGKTAQNAPAGGGEMAIACDLGSDLVRTFSFNKDAPQPLLAGEVFASKPGSGPRHGVFHPAGKYLYIANELASTVDVFAREQTGLAHLQTLSTLPPDFAGSSASAAPNTAAAIKLSPDARCLYVSNRGGYDSIAVFRVKPNAGATGGGNAGRETAGLLEYAAAIPSGGKAPRDFAIDPTGRYLLACHQDSDNLTVFRIDQTTGIPSQIGEYGVASGVCIMFRQ